MGKAYLAALRGGAIGAVLTCGVAGTTGAETVIHDLGGGLESRFQQLAAMQARDEAVSILGTCFSACTLYLGLERVCVAPEARLGFHGPSTALPGLPLPAAEFDRQSRRMAAYYPPALRRWFLEEARYVTGDVYLLTGAQVIALGVKAC